MVFVGARVYVGIAGSHVLVGVGDGSGVNVCDGSGVRVRVEVGPGVQVG